MARSSIYVLLIVKMLFYLLTFISITAETFAKENAAPVYAPYMSRNLIAYQKQNLFRLLVNYQIN